MSQLPSMQRTELWHPMIVHFPIVLLILATITALMFFLFKDEKKKVFLRYTSFWLLISGIITIWISIITGDLAYNIEVRKLCDPQVLKTHEYWGYITAYIFSIAGILDIISISKRVKLHKLLKTIKILLLIAGTAGLLYIGHLGASLVYQQEAGVHRVSSDCHEF